MAQYIDKSALVAEIENRIKSANNDVKIGAIESLIISKTLNGFKSFINTLEVKEVKTWHLQEKEDIYDAVKDWGPQTFVCVMKDGSIQKFIGSLDEDYEGHINVHINGANDGYDNVDDIVKWIEII